MQGLKEQNTPSGRRHWAAEATACMNMHYATSCICQSVRRHAEAEHVSIVMLTHVFVPAS